MEDPLDGALNEPYPLTEEQVADYRRRGFIKLEGVFTGEALAALREAVEIAVESERDADWMGARDGRARALPQSYQRIFDQRVNIWRRHPSVAAFTLSRRMGDIAKRLEGRPMRLWHDQALFKQPDDEATNRTPWHQDSVLWPHSSIKHSTSAWIALRPTTTQSGCLSFLTGSHALGPQKVVNLADPHDIFAETPGLRGREGVACPLEAGDCTFHNGLTFHFAGANRTETTREGYAVIFMPAETRFTGAWHPVTADLDLAPDQPFAPFDDRFPRVGSALAQAGG
jgi:ectoine hydroxylase-related dioxygenase (phytanoyl-CoA dioxygenase family)